MLSWTSRSRSAVRSHAVTHVHSLEIFVAFHGAITHLSSLDPHPDHARPLAPHLALRQFLLPLAPEALLCPGPASYGVPLNGSLNRAGRGPLSGLPNALHGSRPAVLCDAPR